MIGAALPSVVIFLHSASTDGDATMATRRQTVTRIHPATGPSNQSRLTPPEKGSLFFSLFSNPKRHSRSQDHRTVSPVQQTLWLTPPTPHAPIRCCVDPLRLEDRSNVHQRETPSRQRRRSRNTGCHRGDRAQFRPLRTGADVFPVTYHPHPRATGPGSHRFKKAATPPPPETLETPAQPNPSSPSSSPY